MVLFGVAASGGGLREEEVSAGGDVALVGLPVEGAGREGFSGSAVGGLPGETECVEEEAEGPSGEVSERKGGGLEESVKDCSWGSW